MYYIINKKEYWIESCGTGTPVVFLHGFTGSSSTWASYMNTWKNNYKVIAVDLPGHGKTKIVEPVRIEEFCEDLDIILDLMDIDNVHLIGYSMGGRVALSFALTHPKRVASLTLESASPGLVESKEQLARQTKDEVLAKKIEEQGILKFVDYWETIPLFASQNNLSDPVRFAIRQERLSQSPAGLASSLRGMGTGKQPSWWEKLPTLSSPVLLVVGELDKKFVGIARRMDKYIGTSTLRIISQAGHAVHVEQSQIFGTIVNEFIKQCIE
ncbi:2-succinyl-6-hydroxy-2,4-cyclohexadiene-1-carboxylate synthase [Aquibacillus halophilus]|uniref:Putative 2-succinyl-6-hydroxy-2,4-cyclohexadiene-1-carboxylate synthase n=1 Tax=Aquibacillus halophilus TaxID=930132 RepID=A0A6A8DU92_9BACI|nr:2-succinyl-6-hydroxy-2,4-cyclohexadiene-1-carboxylate synthase [Aquibacillus halophilus]